MGILADRRLTDNGRIYRQGEVQRDAQGREYVISPTGESLYVPTPGERPEDGFFSNYTWNPRTGQWEQHTDWAHVGALASVVGVGGLAAAPFIAGAAGGAGAGGVGGAGAAGAGSTAAGAGAGGFVGADIAGTEAAALGGGVLPSAALAGAGAYAPLASGAGSSLMGAGGSAAALGGGGATLGSALATTGKGYGLLNGIRQAGSILSNSAAADASGRRQDEGFNRTAADSNNRAALEDAQFNLNAPSTLARQTAQGDAMSYDYKPASHTGSGRDLQFSGGIGPWIYGPNTKAAGQALSNQSLNTLQTGGYRLNPQITPNATPSGREDAMGKAGMILSILGTLGSMYGGGR